MLTMVTVIMMMLVIMMMVVTMLVLVSMLMCKLTLLLHRGAAEQRDNRALADGFHHRDERAHPALDDDQHARHAEEAREPRLRMCMCVCVCMCMCVCVCMGMCICRCTASRCTPCCARSSAAALRRSSRS